MRDLEYQTKVLRSFEAYLSELSAQKKRADGIAEVAKTQPDLNLPVPDFTGEAWSGLKAKGVLPASRSDIPFSPRIDGVGRPVPNACFKVPTGGGKTYLAVGALSRLFGTYLGKNVGFVLWIVPNEAIYTQTKKQLTDREHPYRQMLDRAAAGRVKILEKEDPLDARDIESNLCVMLLMLQSANRDTKDSLRMFRDRGNIRGFFPPETDGEAHRALLDAIPNLAAYSDAESFWPVIKDSLGNALRIVRPVVVMDEGHRAVSDLAFRTLYDFNPCFVLELTATPKDRKAKERTAPPIYANLLVDVMGADLDREGMIKMPLNVFVKNEEDWRSTLQQAKEKLEELASAAERLRADRDRYIRPILLVQVERTGKDQRDGHHIHAEDAKDWLVRAGFDERQIAIKTAETNDLTAPENIDLLSPLCPVRVIITKQALQEGWDCPFAYVLCVLAASTNLSAMTQLVGRILRQPQAEKTGVAALDECYVFCHHMETSSVVAGIKQGLEDDGMGDLVKYVVARDEKTGKKSGARKVARREKFRDTEIYFPLVLNVSEADIRPLDYEQDVVFGIDWNKLDVAALAASIPANAQVPETQMKRIRLSDAGGERIVSEDTGHIAEAQSFDPVYLVRMVSDIVPNPWTAREIVGNLEKALRKRGFDNAMLGAQSGLIVGQLRAELLKQRDDLAETVFRAAVEAGRIQFHLRTDENNWRMPHFIETEQPENARTLRRKNDNPIERSLFAPIYEADFSSQDERDIAVYLDGEAALKWWHRNVARAGQYSLQGWRKDKVYPDLLFALQRGDDIQRLVVLEMKGEHLSGNPDTEYKKSLLKLVAESYQFEQVTSAGKLELVQKGKTTVECDLVLMTDWQRRLPGEFLT
ncbi:type III restriction endonuclease subunit R [Parvibaculum sedimenti]|uniref:Type III restriction endonuclease subunit R n=2 Tax=Parvibaculum sedimenti TaxID=2608632 RepID=A0A6N6VMT8_9HYPH|nr:type III restriction endonuclease subunit R [Parvibaculum sedimenti]